MRGILKFIFTILLVLAATAFFAQGSIAQVKKTISYEMSPCSQPLKYYIAEIDPKFNLTSEEVKQDMEKAVSLWNETYGKDLFVYDEQGEIPVYFVYDNRQKLNSEINKLEGQLNKGGAQLDKQMTDFKKKIADFEARQSAYNNEVQAWNDRGGAPEGEYNRLQEQAKQLKSEADQLNEEAKKLTAQAKSYNAQVGDLNSTINSFNEVLGEQPEEGIYIEEKTTLFDPGRKKIEIYFVPSKNELIHTLAHEFGHALHIDHNTNAKSIMYHYTSESRALSQEDKDALTDACQNKSLGQVLGEKGALILANYERMFNRSGSTN